MEQAPLDLETDVAVLGGGLVGPALAIALAEAGFEVAVLDRAPVEIRQDPEFDGRAYAIALGTERLLTAIGVWDDVADRAEPVREIEIAEGAGTPTLMRFDPRKTDEGRVAWILEDRFLRAALHERMASAGVRHIAPAAYGGTALDGGWRRLDLAGGGAARARLAIAADGRRSSLARDAGIRRIGWSYAQTGLVNAIAHSEPHGGVARQSFFPGGPFAVLPLPGNRSSIVWSERRAEAERLTALDDRAFESELARRIGGRLGELKLAGRRWAYPLDLTLAERYGTARLALVGDAAHGVHPIAGQGFNLGIRDVAALVETVVAAARRGEDIGNATTIAEYERWRRFDATTMALGMDALNRLFSNAVPGLGTLRRTGLAAIDRLDGLKRRFMREAAGVEGDLPRLLRGEMP